MSILSPPQVPSANRRSQSLLRGAVGAPSRKSSSNKGGLLASVARRLVLSRLRKLREGRLILSDGQREEVLGSRDAGDTISARVTVSDPRFYPLVLLGGDLGAAEAYLQGHFQCDDLVSLFRILLQNLEEADGLERGFSRLKGVVERFRHRLRTNTRRGSRQNIHAHYDLGNDFFELFLDETMTYSCGIFETSSSSLTQASIAKLDRICHKLELRSSDHVVEIGSGWGSFAIHAASKHGCRVTTTTISQAQLELATRRVREAGLEGQVTVLLQDYRELQGQFDKLASIEMVEAVGHEHLNSYFQTCQRILKPDGIACIQAITMPDHRYDQYRRSVDFIQRHVFPGCCVPSLGALVTAASVTDLRLIHLEDITPHYATTLRLWRERFLHRADEVRRLGYPESFLRLWEYYLAYCEAGFTERYTGDLQMIFARPRWRGAPILPALTPSTREA